MKALLLMLMMTVAQGAFASETTKETTVGVKGMVCAFCAQGIEKSFMAQKEVAGIEVSLANKFVKIKFKEGQKLSNEKIAELLKESGYEAVFGG
jgi:periplasmic mercuric ion binding protein